MIRSRLTAIAFFVPVLGLATMTGGSIGARANDCGVSDFICRKFSKKEPVAKKRTRRSRSRARRSPPRRRAESRDKAVQSAAVSPKVVPTPASRKPALVITRPKPQIVPLSTGAISEAPGDLPNLFFGTGDRVELATAKCQPTERSDRRVTCAVAVHQLALTTEAGAGCTASLSLRDVEFAKSEKGEWVNEDSIALCGGRLLRRSELRPVSVDGEPRYALKEEYQMLGGDSACAAPYLKSRRPLRKSYLPTLRGTRKLTCGAVAAR